MNNEKIKVTVQVGDEIRAYEGDLIQLDVFRSDGEHGMGISGETCGSHFIPAVVADGSIDSTLRMIHEISKNRESELKLLSIIGMRLMERMKTLDEFKEEKQKPEMSVEMFFGKQNMAVLRGILAAMEKEGGKAE